MEHLSNYHKDHPNQHQNGHKLCDEREHPVRVTVRGIQVGNLTSE